MENNIRPETMKRITDFQLAAAFMALLDMIKNGTLILEIKNDEFYLYKGGN